MYVKVARKTTFIYDVALGGTCGIDWEIEIFHGIGIGNSEADYAGDILMVQSI